jgi:putative two-component system response regulator
VYHGTTDIHDLIKTLPVTEIMHMKRVGELMRLLAESLWKPGVSPLEYSYYGEAALYHDIGKVMVPRNILLKTDRLTDMEMSTVLKHPLFAKKIFLQMKKGFVCGIPMHLFDLALDAAVYHHERWDGNGYPYG